MWQEIGLIDYIPINLSTKIDKIMEPQKKNKPNSLVLILFALVILMVIIYFILVLFFPTVFDLMNTGEIEPISPNN